MEGNIENKSDCTTLVDTKTIFEPDPNPKNNPIWPKKKTKPKTNHKLGHIKSKN